MISAEEAYRQGACDALIYAAEYAESGNYTGPMHDGVIKWLKARAATAPMLRKLADDVGLNIINVKVPVGEDE